MMKIFYIEYKINLGFVKDVVLEHFMGERVGRTHIYVVTSLLSSFTFCRIIYYYYKMNFGYDNKIFCFTPENYQWSEMEANETYLNQDDEANLKNGIRELMSLISECKPVSSDIYKQLRDVIIEKLVYEEPKNITKLRISDDYKYSHPINVAIYATSLGIKLNYDIDELNSLCLAGILFDIGKLRIPDQIINKQGALTPKEFEVIKLHAPLGYKIVKEELGLPEDIAKPALEHHEKFDGSGYPRKLQRNAIGDHSQIIAICDVFDAIISAKSYGTNKPFKEGLKIILGYGSSWFNPSLLYTFVHSTGFKD